MKNSDSNSFPSLFATMTALALVLGLCACGQESGLPAGYPAAAAPHDTVRIVSSMPTKGAQAAQAKQIVWAIDLAIAERAGKVGKWKIDHIALEGGDDETGEWSHDRELMNAEAAADDPSVIAYIGPYHSGACAVSLPVTNRAGLLQGSPSVTWPGLTEAGWNPGEPDIYYPSGKSNFARMMPSDVLQADAAIMWAIRLDVKRMALLEDGSTYSAGLAERFADVNVIHQIESGPIISIDPFDLGSLAQKVMGYDAVFYAPSSVANAVSVAKALHLPGITVFSSDTALDPQFAQTAKDGENWRVVSNSVDLSFIDASKEFRQQFLAKYGEEPGQFAANAYDLTNMVLDGVLAHGRDRAKMISYVLTPVPYAAASGELAFAYGSEGDEMPGDRVGWTMTGYRLIGGKFQQEVTLQSFR